jgi:hypothetical protein
VRIQERSPRDEFLESIINELKTLKALRQPRNAGKTAFAAMENLCA